MNYAYDLVFLVEEASMKVMLDNFLPKILPDNLTFLCIPHEGKQDLEKSIPRKLKAWGTNTKFIILRDQDSGDCLQVKNTLRQLCQQAGREDVLIRIVCCELESWFLGDLKAVGKAFGKEKLSRLQNNKKYRNPDQLNCAKQELRKLVAEYQPISGSRKIAQYLDLNNNTSQSFKVFIQGLNQILNSLEF